jgi:hypothetical protein
VGLVIQPPQDLTTLRLHDSSLEAKDIGAGLHQRYRPPKGKSNAGIRLVRHAVVPRFCSQLSRTRQFAHRPIQIDLCLGQMAVKPASRTGGVAFPMKCLKSRVSGNFVELAENAGTVLREPYSMEWIKSREPLQD